MKSHPPVLLRLCTDELEIVSYAWWEKFLLSYEKSLAKQKKEAKGAIAAPIQVSA
jgi:hypothetical protein